jgi:hypothetical protein
VTLISAGRGRDILTGDRLDRLDRLMNLTAALIPVIPATVLIPPARLVRQGIEDIIYGRITGDRTTMVGGAKATRTGAAGVKEAVTSVRSKGK